MSFEDRGLAFQEMYYIDHPCRCARDPTDSVELPCLDDLGERRLPGFSEAVKPGPPCALRGS